MIGIDTTFLVQLEVREMPEHRAAHALLTDGVLNEDVPVGLSPQMLTEFLDDLDAETRKINRLRIQVQRQAQTA